MTVQKFVVFKAEGEHFNDSITHLLAHSLPRVIP